MSQSVVDKLTATDAVMKDNIAKLIKSKVTAPVLMLSSYLRVEWRGSRKFNVEIFATMRSVFALPSANTALHKSQPLSNILASWAVLVLNF